MIESEFTPLADTLPAHGRANGPNQPSGVQYIAIHTHI